MWGASASAAEPACDGVVLKSAPVEALTRGMGGTELDAGLLGGSIIQELVAAICDDELRRWAGASCETSSDMDELRRRVAIDVLRLPGQVHSQSPQAGRSLEVALAAASVDAWLTQADVRWFAKRVGAEPQPTGAFVANACAVGAPRTKPQGLEEVSRFLTALAEVDRGAPIDEQVAALQAELTRIGVKASSAQAELVRQVIDHAKRLETQRTIDGYSALALLSAELVTGRRPELARFLGATERLSRGDLRAGARELTEWLAGLGGAVPSAVTDALDIAAAVALARDEAAAKRALARALLPVGPWAENILADINIGTVSLSDRGYAFAGDLLLGYQTSDFGVDLRGAVYEYDLSKDRRIIQISQRELQLEGWLNLGREELSFEIRGEGKVAFFDSTRISAVPGESLLFDETSYMGRGLGLFGVRAQPSPYFAGGLWLGGGFQYEDYSPLQTQSTTTVTFSDDTNTALILEARLRAQWAFWPQTLVARVRADAVRYEMARQSQATLVSGGSVQSSESSESAVTLEAHVRGYVDLELARLFGFVPGVYGGFDSLSIDSSSQGELSSFGPVFGVGVRRVSF